MQIQIRSDNHIHVHAARAAELESIVKHALRHCSQHVTRVELHLSDINGTKAGQPDKCCVMEVRLERLQPMAVTETSQTIGESVTGAAEKLERLIKALWSAPQIGGRRHLSRSNQPNRIDPGWMPAPYEYVGRG